MGSDGFTAQECVARRGERMMFRFILLFKFIVFVVVSGLLSPAYADSWVAIEYDVAGLAYKSNSSVQNKTATAADSLQRLDTVPFMKVKWLDENSVVLKEKNMTDPRAFWAPMGEHGTHEAIFIRSDGMFMLKKPHSARSVEIEFLHASSSGRVTEKVSFE